MLLLPEKDKCIDTRGPAAPSFGERHEPSPGEHSKPKDGKAMAILTLSHTPAEHKVYQVMLAEANTAKTRVCAFSTRQLMTLTQLPNYGAIRRAITGLINKLSIENHKVAGDGIQHASIYLIFSPEEILSRRAAADLSDHAKQFQAHTDNKAYAQAVERVAERYDLSRREAQVALCCAEGLTNTKIGERLYISEQTVKFHLRHIFIKYGLKRRTELVSRLLTQESLSKT